MTERPLDQISYTLDALTCWSNNNHQNFKLKIHDNKPKNGKEREKKRKEIWTWLIFPHYMFVSYFHVWVFLFLFLHGALLLQGTF